MSNSTYENDLYNYQKSNIQIKPIYNEPIKRDTIYEDVKVHKPIYLQAGEINSYLNNIQSVNDNNLYSEYPASNNNIGNNKNYNNYFNQTKIELEPNQNIEKLYNTNNSNKITYLTQNNNSSDINAFTNKQFAKTKKIEGNNQFNSTNIQIKNKQSQTFKKLPPKNIQYTEIKSISNNQNLIGKDLIQNVNINNLEITSKPIEQLPIEEKEIAIVRRITEEKTEKTNNIEIVHQIEGTKTSDNPNILNKIDIQNLPGPAKISKMPNSYIPLNPRVRFAKEEKKINIIKIENDNNNNNKLNDIITNNNTINITKKVEPVPEIKKEEMETKKDIFINIDKKNDNDKDILYVDKINNTNNTIVNMITKKEEAKNEELNLKRPNDDFNSRKPDGKFHPVKILKKNPSNQLFAKDGLFDIEDYQYINKVRLNEKPKANQLFLNNRIKKFQKKEEFHPIISVKKINLNNENNENKNATTEYSNQNYENIKKKEYEVNNNLNFGYANNFNKDESLKDLKYNNNNDDEDIIYDNGEVKDTDEINIDLKINEDSKIKRMNNNDEFDEFDNNFNEHEKFYQKMKNLFDDLN